MNPVQTTGICRICGDGPFQDGITMLMHSDRYHPRYVCDVCQRQGWIPVPKFGSWNRLRQHKRTVHRDNRAFVPPDEKLACTLDQTSGRFNMQQYMQSRITGAVQVGIAAALGVADMPLVRADYGESRGMRRRYFDNDDSDEDIYPVQRRRPNYYEEAVSRNRPIHPRVVADFSAPSVSRAVSGSISGQNSSVLGENPVEASAERAANEVTSATNIQVRIDALEPAGGEVGEPVMARRQVRLDLPARDVYVFNDGPAQGSDRDDHVTSPINFEPEAVEAEKTAQAVVDDSVQDAIERRLTQIRGQNPADEASFEVSDASEDSASVLVIDEGVEQNEVGEMTAVVETDEVHAEGSADGASQPGSLIMVLKNAEEEPDDSGASAQTPLGEGESQQDVPSVELDDQLGGQSAEDVAPVNVSGEVEMDKEKAKAEAGHGSDETDSGMALRNRRVKPAAGKSENRRRSAKKENTQ